MAKRRNSGWPYDVGTEDEKQQKEGGFYTPSETKCPHCGSSPLDAARVGYLYQCKKCGKYV